MEEINLILFPLTRLAVLKDRFLLAACYNYDEEWCLLGCYAVWLL
jgi:hypothetical protein